MMSLWIITGLLIKHFLVDFPFQTQAMIQGKGTYLQRDGILHSLFHGLATSAVFFLFGFGPLSLALGLLDFLIHYHVDWTKSNINRHFNLRPDQNAFWNALGIDQLAHGLTYVLLTALALNK
jgi:hypothetical protein